MKMTLAEQRALRIVELQERVASKQSEIDALERQLKQAQDRPKVTAFPFTVPGVGTGVFGWVD